MEEFNTVTIFPQGLDQKLRTQCEMLQVGTLLDLKTPTSADERWIFFYCIESHKKHTPFKYGSLPTRSINHIKTPCVFNKQRRSHFLSPQMHAVNISSLQMFTSVFAVKLSSRWKINDPIVSAFASLSMRCVTLLHGPVGRTDRPVNQKQRLIWPLGAEHKARFTTAALLTSGFSIRLIISYWPLWHEVYVHHTNIDGKARVCICVHVSLKTMMHHSF